MNSKTKHIVLLSLLVVMVAACTPERDQSSLFSPEDINLLVVEAVLIVGQPYPSIKLSRTQAPDVPFDPNEAAEQGAQIVITSEIGAQVYAEHPDQPGLYFPSSGWVNITPETEYRLRVESLSGEVLTAVTTTPATLVVDSWVLLDPSGSTITRTLDTFAEAGDDVYFQPNNQITYAEGLVEARFAPGGASQFSGDGYQVSLFSIDLDSDYVIDPPFFEDEDFEDLGRMGSSPVVTGDSGNLRLPWFGIYFEGRHLFKLFVVDNNWYDLVRSTPQGDGALGFGGNVGDSFERPLFNVEGGIGLFGSASVDSLGFYVHPEPQP